MGANKSNLKPADSSASLSISQQETKQIPKHHQLQNHDLEKFRQFLESKVLISIYPSPDSQTIKVPSTKPAARETSQSIHRVVLNQEKNEENDFDGRTQILATGEWPYSVHGVIAFRFSNFTSWGTGILIGPNVVLTAGHNLYDHKYKVYSELESMQFLPAMNGQALPFGPVEVEQYFISPSYLQEESKEDYGILILKEPIGEKTGYFGLACLDPEELQSQRVVIVGYPGDKVASKLSCYEMWGMEGDVSHVVQEKGFFKHLVDTEAGQSGSGVWYQDGEDFYVCGVHISGTHLANTATLLTRAMYKQIHEWLQRTSLKREFSFKLGEKKELDFGELRINKECLSLLMKYNLRDLTCLRLCSQEIGNEEVKILAKNASWVNLSVLDLSHNKIDGEGVKELAQNTSWINLLELNLSFNNVGVEGIQELKKNVYWGKLSADKIHI